ncbi:MAG: S9 family peptidase [candidate division WOR-3 bacterium]|nr:MAG: S9 family peptidase [candidate division WOR-3 bacterium]
MKINETIMILILLATVAGGDVDRYRKDNLLLENIPQIPTTVVARLQPYQNIRGAAFYDWLPMNSGILIRTRFAESSQIHVVETPKGMRRQITFFDEGIAECTVCPDPRKPILLFTKDKEGNEVHQIYEYNYSTGAYRLLSDGKSKFNSIVWSRKGDRFAFRSNRRNRRDYDIYLGDLRGEKSFRLIMRKGGYWYPVEFSPDDRKLLVKQYVSSDESYYYIIDMKNEKATPMHNDTAKVSYGTARWSPDMRGIYVVSDRFGNFKQLLYYDLQNATFEILTKQITWDIGEIEISPSGSSLAFTSNENGFGRLYLMDTGTRALSRVSLPDAQIYNLVFKPDGDELAITLNRPTQPSDVYTLNLKTKKFLRWTQSELGGLDTLSFVAPRLVQYETFDSVQGQPRTIPAYYYEPRKFKPPYPVLIDCHGGPAVQEKPYFYYLFQFFLNDMGIAVIAPNVRGSTGYGREFMMLDDGYNRENSVKDIGALLDWIEEQPQLNSRRVAISGASYGGYLVLAAMVKYNERLRCGIDQLGISNFVTFLENTSEYRQDLRREEYGDERDPTMREFLTHISPLTNAHLIKKPMFIVQGLNDPRVPASEAEQIVKAIRKNDVEVWYLLAEDEGHGFGKKSNRNFYQQAMVLFLEKYLLGKK